MIADRQTFSRRRFRHTHLDIHTNTLITILCSPVGGEVIKSVELKINGIYSSRQSPVNPLCRRKQPLHRNRNKSVLNLLRSALDTTLPAFAAERRRPQHGARSCRSFVPSAPPLCISALKYDTIRYDTRCYSNVRSKADMSQLNLPHGTDN